MQTPVTMPPDRAGTFGPVPRRPARRLAARSSGSPWRGPPWQPELEGKPSGSSAGGAIVGVSLAGASLAARTGGHTVARSSWPLRALATAAAERLPQSRQSQPNCARVMNPFS